MYVRGVSAERYRWVVLAAGTLAQASFSASSVGLPALSPTLKSEYGLSLTQTGVVLAAVGIGMLFTLLPWGLVADRVDERWVIATGLTGAAALLVAASRTHTFGAVTGVLVGVGALGASVNAASGRAIMAWFPSTELGLALGIRQTAIPIGGALGAAVLPVLGSSGGTHLAFLFLAAASLTGALIAAVFIRGRQRRRAGGRRRDAAAARPLHVALGTGTGLYLLAQIGITGLRRPLPPRGARTVEGSGGRGPGGDLRARDRGAHQLRDGLRPARRPARPATDDRRRARAAHGLRRRRRRRASRAPHPALRRRRRAEHVVERARLRGRRGGGAGPRAPAPPSASSRRCSGSSSREPLPSFAAVAAHSWRLAFFLAAAGPAVGVLVLQRLREPVRGRRLARTRGTSANLPAARRTPD